MIRARIARPFVFVIAGAAVLGVALLMAVLYETTTIECSRVRGAEGACVVTQRRIVGRSQRILPASAIRGASMSVGTSHRAGASAGHTDTTFVIDLSDGSQIVVDEMAFAFLDPSFEKDDAQAIDRFVADKTIEHTRATNGGLRSMLAIIGALAALAASLVWMWGFVSIAISIEGDALVVSGDETSRHAIKDVTNVDVDEAYRSLRVHYHDGTSRQTARLGVPIARLEGLAAQTRALLGLDERK